MGGSVSRDTFEWIYTEEPHFSRRKAMLKKYPEMKKLMGHDNNMARIMVAMVITQVIACYLIQDESWLTVLIVGYCFGGVVNHSMTLALHETGHNLPFGHAKPMRNRLIGFLGNCIIGVPISISFRRYHHDHHRYQGEDKLDPDIPSELEGMLFRNRFTKMIWMILQPGFYAIRPFLKRPKVPCKLEFYNLLVQIVFDVGIIYFMNWKALAYLFFGTVLCMGIHPLAGHFISEHYLYAGYDSETYSYYGPYNYIAFNVGYHMEHHDFPNIPGPKLPLVRKIAPEFYDDLPSHDSFAAVVWDFIMNPKNGPFNRTVRPASKDPTLPDPWAM
ncbi:sphingolipid delta(4)-desaturase DES1-like [Anneissia japonica]|uniref:sphingolipid delta(4)-desaturase DES1-like n=1 Tax=Anneissia japonica TaxID=1529436 RepID=UPI001425A574|nr:sphingolipid delta(4)-desaturase DES1-like [Anneissia japonica]